MRPDHYWNWSINGVATRLACYKQEPICNVKKEIHTEPGLWIPFYKPTLAGGILLGALLVVVIVLRWISKHDGPDRDGRWENDGK